jgi:hypothetical protein
MSGFDERGIQGLDGLDLSDKPPVEKKKVPPEEKKEAKAETAENGQSPKVEDEVVRARLSDKAFLEFLQKDPDSIKHATDDVYLAEKVKVFDRLKTIGKEVQKFVGSETAKDFEGVINDPFLQGIERVAIRSSKDFLFFADRVSGYIKSLERINGLQSVYLDEARKMGMSVDFNGLSDAQALELVQKILTENDFQRVKTEGDIWEVQRKGLTFWDRFSRKAINAHDQKLADLQKKLLELKSGRFVMNDEAITEAISERQRITESLRGNVSFGFVREQFGKRMFSKIDEAKVARDDQSIAQARDFLANLKQNKNLFAPLDDVFGSLSEEFDDYAKEAVGSKTNNLMEAEDATLNSFESGVKTLKAEGLKLGLNSAECNKEIAGVLKTKIEQLTKEQGKGQNRVKIILAKRILAKLK